MLNCKMLLSSLTFEVGGVFSSSRLTFMAYCFYGREFYAHLDGLFCGTQKSHRARPIIFILYWDNFMNNSEAADYQIIAFCIEIILAARLSTCLLHNNNISLIQPFKLPALCTLVVVICPENSLNSLRKFCVNHLSGRSFVLPPQHSIP